MLTKTEMRVKLLTPYTINNLDGEGGGALHIIPRGAVGTLKGATAHTHGEGADASTHYALAVQFDHVFTELAAAAVVSPKTISVEIEDVEMFGVQQGLRE